MSHIIFAILLLLLGLFLFIISRKKEGLIPKLSDITGVLAFILALYLLIAPQNQGDTTTTETSEPQEELAEESFYDDFNNPEFDGDIDTQKWSKMFDDGCLAYQQNGAVFLTTNKSNSTTLLCSFLVRNPRWIEKSELNIFQANFRISDDHNKEFVAQVLEFNTNDGWNISCGIEAGQEGPEIVLDSKRASEGWVHESTPILYNKWYKVRLEVDSNSMTFSCYIDDTFFASASAKNLDNALFSQNILGLRSANAFATTSFDDVLISP